MDDPLLLAWASARQHSVPCLVSPAWRLLPLPQPTPQPTLHSCRLLPRGTHACLCSCSRPRQGESFVPGQAGNKRPKPPLDCIGQTHRARLHQSTSALTGHAARWQSTPQYQAARQRAHCSMPRCWRPHWPQVRSGLGRCGAAAAAGSLWGCTGSSLQAGGPGSWLQQGAGSLISLTTSPDYSSVSLPSSSPSCRRLKQRCHTGVSSNK